MDGCDVKKAVVFGMPCCKKWCFYRPEQPLYYQDDNGHAALPSKATATTNNPLTTQIWSYRCLTLPAASSNGNSKPDVTAALVYSC